MATKLSCPDCGGIIGEAAPGESPCTCFSMPAETTGKSDTAVVEAIARPEKICVVCGKDTTGHRRLKDSRGYICLPCAKAEKAAEKAGKVRCKFCRKLVKPDGLVPFRGKMICRKCFADAEETERFKKKIDTKLYDQHEKRNLIILCVIFGILAVIVLYSLFTKHS